MVGRMQHCSDSYPKIVCLGCSRADCFILCILHLSQIYEAEIQHARLRIPIQPFLRPSLGAIARSHSDDLVCS